MSTREIATSDTIDHDTNQVSQRDEQIRLAFHMLDSPNGVVRHASFTESRFCALFITRDNVQTLLQSTDPRVVQRLARRMLAHLTLNVLSVDIDTLDSLEEQWTGTARCSRSFSLIHTKFFVVATLATYLTRSWHQLRELSIIAVAEDAFELIVEASKLVSGKRRAQRPVAHPVDKPDLTETISHLQEIKPDHSLLAAIRRTIVRLCPSDQAGKLKMNRDDGDLRGIVQYVYSSFKRGVSEPSESFLRVSSRYERLQNNVSENLYLFTENLHVSTWNIVLVTGSGPSTGGRTSSNCAYILGENVDAPTTADLAVAIKKTFENQDVYHTIRDSGSANSWGGSKAWRALWNIENVYGFCRDYELFLAWLDHLGCGTPQRLGAPRDAAGSGEYLLVRNLNPWHDPRLPGVPTAGKVYVLYKSMVLELLY